MRPLTDDCPKPLLEVNGRPLIEHQVTRLAAAGITDIIINTAYLGHMIRSHLGNGRRFGVAIEYSAEPEPLETGGAIARALPLLGGQPFLLVNGDIWTDIDYARLLEQSRLRVKGRRALGLLVLVATPPFKSRGDFALAEGGTVLSATGVHATFTFSGVSILSPRLVSDYPRRRRIFPLGEVFAWAVGRRQLAGVLHEGYWLDVGTPARLQELRQYLTRVRCSSGSS